MTNDPNWRLPAVPTFLLTSPDFAEGDRLPDWARADSGNRAPRLQWSGAPEATKSFVVSLYDPDAPTGSGFWHFAAYNLPADLTELNIAELPDAAVVVKNEMGQYAYMGAAPPAGDDEHRYVYTVSALSETIDIPADATPAVLGFMLRTSIIGRAQLTGTMVTPGSRG